MDLTAEELRVLGCLLEKQRTTPDAYPLTVNALVSSCNQTTNRDPVVRYDEEAVERALARLRERGLAGRGVYPGSRTTKHRHVLDQAIGLEPDEQAVLALLLLRGPQTLGELKARTERLHAFVDLGTVEETLERLAVRPDPCVRRREREPGRKDARWAHALGDCDTGTRDAPDLAARVSALEVDVARLRAAVDLMPSTPEEPDG